jgi:CHAT domain-containing protein/Tfp pilus assembly protein PilF
MTYLRNLVAHAVLGFGVLSLFAGGGLPLFAQGAAPTSEHSCSGGVLEDPGGCVVTLAPGQTMSLSLAVANGKVRMLTAEQVDGAIEVRLASAVSSAADAFINQAGVHSRISVLVTSGDRTILSNLAKDKPAKTVLTASAERAADSNTELERAAERAFAHAELLRIQDTHDHSAAITAYDEAIANWQNAGNRSELARAVIWKADYIVNNEGKAPLALPVIERATPMLSDLDPIEAAHYWLVIAFIHVVHGDYDVTQDAYRRSLALYAAAGDTGHQAKILDNSARVELMEGHSDIALTDEKHAAELAAAAGDARRQAFVQEELAAIYSTEGDSEAAYRAYGEALQALKHLPPEPRMEAAIWVGLSDLYMTLGDFARVQDSLDQATAIWKTTDYPVGMTDTLNNYGDLYLLKGSPREARKYFERGLALAGSVEYERGSIALMSGLGDSYLYEHDAVHAEQVLNSALARAKKAQQTDSEMQVHCQLGDLALLKHDVKEAAEQYATCSKEAVAANDVYTRIRAEGGLARIALESGALDDGQTHCERALGMIEAIRGELRNQDIKTSFFASQHAYYDLDIQILERMDKEHPDEGYAWQAFLIAERARARSLLDQVAATDAHREASPSLLALYEDVQRRLRKLETSSRENPQSVPASQSTRAALEKLTVSEHQLHDEIVAMDDGSKVAIQSYSLTLKSIQDALPDTHAVLLEYWTGETASYAWSITRTGIRSFRLPPAANLARQCLSYRKAVMSVASTDPTLTAERRAALRTEQDAELHRIGGQLSTTLLPRNDIVPGTTMVFLVSDGPIESLPFAALPSAKEAQARGIDFLTEPSATIFSLLEIHPVAPHPMRVAIFAEPPSVSGTGGEVRVSPPHLSSSNDARDHSQHFAALPFADNEAMMIRATMGTEATHLFSDAEVSRNTLQTLHWNDFSIGHFAMHAVLNQQYAELSGLTLGQQRGDASGNFLWYGDVRHLHTKLDLVVLSACNTALGEQVPGEGLQGLTQAFFAAGSQRVLGTLWQVDDQATSEWMRYFYQSLKKNRSPVAALHEAQKAMAADPQWSAPYYWTGFVLSGDWRPLP